MAVPGAFPARRAAYKAAIPVLSSEYRGNFPAARKQIPVYAATWVESSCLSMISAATSRSERSMKPPP